MKVEMLEQWIIERATAYWDWIPEICCRTTSRDLQDNVEDVVSGEHGRFELVQRIRVDVLIRLKITALDDLPPSLYTLTATRAPLVTWACWQDTWPAWRHDIALPGSDTRATVITRNCEDWGRGEAQCWLVFSDPSTQYCPLITPGRCLNSRTCHPLTVNGMSGWGGQWGLVNTLISQALTVTKHSMEWSVTVNSDWSR
jgi:hypothetical protein